MGSAHIGTFPTVFSFPGKAVQWFVPSRSVTIVRSGPQWLQSAMVAFLVIEMGPEARARLILQASDSSSGVGISPSPRGVKGLGTQHWKALLYTKDAILLDEEKHRSFVGCGCYQLYSHFVIID